MLIDIVAGKELPDIYKKDKRYAELLVRNNPDRYQIGVEKEEAPKKEENKIESVEAKKSTPKKRGRRPSTK
ncbi:MAG: hypothetical protein AAGA31_05690 [Bacteroidota bacterium]